jgi:hypothetical protein
MATATLTALALFPVLVLLLHLIQRGSYDPASQAVSELALGRDGWLMAIAFCSAGLGMLGFAVLLRTILGRTIVLPGLAVLAAGSTFGSAFVHADGETQSTTHGQIHQILGLMSFVVIVGVMFACAVRFRRVPAWRAFAWPTLAWGIAAVAAFMLVGVLPGHLFGVAQRIFLAVWLSWPITVAARFRGIDGAIERRTPAMASTRG